MKNINVQQITDKLILNPYSRGKKDIVEMIDEMLLEPTLVTFINLHSFYLIEKEIETTEKFNFMFIDGILLKWFLEKSNNIKLERISFDMTSIARDLFDFACREKKTIYFIGGTEDEIEIAVRNIKTKYQDLKIAGFSTGYFKNKIEENRSIFEIISKSPQIIIVGMGTPKQEHFLIALQNAGWQGLGFTCGAFIKQTAKNLDYYPKFFDKFHIRWLYRLLDEPKLFRRYFIEYPIVLIKLIYFRLNNKINQLSN